MKTCQDTATVTGCGRDKPDVEFQRTKTGRMKICRDCLQNNRRGKGVYKIRKERISEGAELYAQFDKLMRIE